MLGIAVEHKEKNLKNREVNQRRESNFWFFNYRYLLPFYFIAAILQDMPFSQLSETFCVYFSYIK